MKNLFSLAAFVVLTFTCMPLHAQNLGTVQERMKERVNRIAPLKTQKIVGENRQGFLEILKAQAADAAAKKLVDEENADRKQVYAAIAAKAGTTAENVGAGRAKRIADTSAAGVMLQRDDGSWYEKQ